MCGAGYAKKCRKIKFFQNCCFLQCYVLLFLNDAADKIGQKNFGSYLNVPSAYQSLGFDQFAVEFQKGSLFVVGMALALCECLGKALCGYVCRNVATVRCFDGALGSFKKAIFRP